MDFKLKTLRFTSAIGFFANYFFWSTFVFFAFGIKPIKAQDIFPPNPNPISIVPVNISTNLKIDGRLDEPEWKLSNQTKLTTIIEPRPGEKPSQQTYIRLLYNSSYLYVSAFCQDSLGLKAIRTPDFQRDYSFQTRDLFAIAFDGFQDKRNAMAFSMDPYGTQRDLLGLDDKFFDPEWDGLWTVRTSRSDSGWVAEVAIPWQTLRYPKTNGKPQDWNLNFIRNRRMTNETTAWSPFPRSFSPLRMEYAGVLKGIQPPPPSATNIRFQPYFLLSNDRYEGEDYKNFQDKTSVKVGGEIKWVLNPNTVMDLTFNTDFAQADVDRQVNNVTRFSVFFPERRQFFLENASLFSVGLYPIEELSGGPLRVIPFFSRTIGLDQNTLTPVPIDAGLRMVFRSPERNAGVIAMRQRETEGSPATNFFVGRFSQNFGKQNRIGIISTLKQSSSEFITDANGVGRFNQLPYTNFVLGIDGFVRVTPTLAWSTMVVGSRTSGEVSSGLSGERDKGISAYSQLHLRNNNWSVWWVQSYVNESFNPAMGFVSRKNIVGTVPGLYYINRGKWLPRKILTFEPGLYTEFYHNANTGMLTERILNFNPVWFNFKNGSGGGIFVTNVSQQLTQAFDPLDIVIASGKYDFWRYSIFVFGDRSKKLAYFFNHERGNYFNGENTFTNARLVYSPLPNISLTGEYEVNDFEKLGIRQESKLVRLYGFQARFALNPRLQLITFYQHNTLNKRDVLNLRVSWEYRPLSFVYLVLNNQAYTQTLIRNAPDGAYDIRFGPRQSENHVIAKISYLKQF
jgi:hypothetical protein